MATIAKLNTTFTADGSAFVKTTNELQKKVEKIEKTSGSSFGSLAKWAKVAAVALIGLVSVNWIKNVMNGAVETYKFARSIGVATNDIYTLQAGLRDTGADASKAGEILGNLSRNLANAATGGAPAYANALERIGLSADELANMPAGEALKKIAEQVSKIEDPTQRAAVAVQLFGDQAKDILPLLTQGGAAFDAAADGAKKLDDIKGAQLEDVQIKWQKFQDTLEGLAMAIASEVLPYITNLIDALPSLGLTGENVTAVMKGTADAIMFVANMVKNFYVTAQLIGKSIQMLFSAFITGVLGIAREGLLAINKLRDKLGMSQIDTSEIDTLFAASKEVTKGYIDEIEGLWGQMMTNLPSSFFDDIFKKADAVGKKLHDVRSAAGALGQAHKHFDIFKKGAEVMNEFRTPLEKFNDRMKELRFMLKNGAIDWDTFAKASNAAVNELEKAHELQKMGYSAGIAGGSTEAYSAINASRQQDDISRKGSPQERLERVMKESQAIEKRQLEEQKKMAEALTNIAIIKG